MLSTSDKQIIESLKSTNPEAYELFMRREKEYALNVKLGCHELRNIVTLISSSYQLLALKEPKLSHIPRWTQIGDDIKALVKAFNDISLFRYAQNVTPASVHIGKLIESVKGYIDDNYHYISHTISICNEYDDYIFTDLPHLSSAICCLIDNAVEAADFTDLGNPPVSINLCASDSFLIISVSNTGATPSDTIINTMYSPFISDKSGHIGLGLSIANEITLSLGGQISYERQNNQTCFTMKIPCISQA